MDDEPDDARTPHVRRRDAARHLFHPGTLKGGFQLSPQPHLHVSALAGIQAGLTAAIALPLVHLSPFAHLIGFAALGTLIALFGRFAPPRQRNRILFSCLVTQTMTVFVMSTLAWLGVSEPVLLAILSLACGVLYFITVTAKFGPPGVLLFVFAGGAAMAPPSSFEAVLERTIAVIVVGSLAWAICALTEPLRRKKQAAIPFPVEPSRPLRNRIFACIGLVLGSAAAILVSKLAGAEHPSWAAMGAIAVMTGAHLRISMHRAAQRMAGTVVGALLAWAVLSLHPDTFVLIGLIVLLQIGTEAIIGFNYGLGQILVTPMALLMTYIAIPSGAGAAMAHERILDTMLGAVIGILAALALSSVRERGKLVDHQNKG